MVRNSIKQAQEALLALQFSPKAHEQALLLLNQAQAVLNGSNADQVEESRRAMGASLRQIAEKEDCECEFRPPNAHFGCVNFLEQ